MSTHTDIGGVLVLDKPAGPTSHDMVLRLRRWVAPAKVGHIGTLDPFATGVLPMCVGQATRLAQYLGVGEKVYELVVRFGFSTDTGDCTGSPLGAPVSWNLDPDELRAALRPFVGRIMQTPPRFSAQKLQGVPLYKLARRGETVAPIPREVLIHEIEVIHVESEWCRLRIRCGPGTYMRSIAADLGEKLGCGAHVAELRRLKSGEFEISHAAPAAVLEAPHGREALAKWLRPLESLLPGYPAIALNEEGLKRVHNGASIGPEHVREFVAGALLRLFSPDGVLVAIAGMTPCSNPDGNLTHTFPIRPLTVF